MDPNDLANQVIQAVQGDSVKTQAISDALASGNPATIKDALEQHAGISISDADAQQIASAVQADPSQPAAFCT